MLRSRYLKSRLLGAFLAVPAAVGVSLPAAPRAAASLTQITNFGTHPTGLQMYLCMPNSVKANPSILLALHGRQGSGTYLHSSTDFGSLADQYGFIVIYPSTNPGGSRWDVSSNQALTRNGGSDPVGLMSMITYTEQHYGGNPNAVHVTGESSGGMMTNVMLADYPDVFKAGAAFTGVPYHCFYTGTVRGWNGPCARGRVSMTAQQWGDLVRNDADPGYTGPRPRVQLWHGTRPGHHQRHQGDRLVLQRSGQPAVERQLQRHDHRRPVRPVPGCDRSFHRQTAPWSNSGRAAAAATSISPSDSRVPTRTS
jgi:poly(hydroxyalkanoate) depolymerase family esterase